MLPRQVAALQALAAAISQQSSALDRESQHAVDGVVEAIAKLAEAVQRYSTGGAPIED